MAEEVDWNAILASQGLATVAQQETARKLNEERSANKEMQELANQRLSEAGYTTTGKQRGTEEVYRATKRAIQQKADEYQPFYGLQFDANSEFLKGVARRFETAAKDILILKKQVRELAQGDLDATARVAMEMVERDRKRKGWGERARYPDRGGRHHLQNAIWESRMIREAGNGYQFVGFDYQVLNELTMPTRSGVGYWADYELGSRGGYIMPRGIWIGPTTEGGTRKSFKGLASAGTEMRGEDRFYPTRHGRASNDAGANKWSDKVGRSGTAGVFAHQAPHPVLEVAISAISAKIGLQLAHLWAEEIGPLLQEQEGGSAEGYHIENHPLGYSTTATMEDLNR